MPKYRRNRGNIDLPAIPCSIGRLRPEFRRHCECSSCSINRHRGRPSTTQAQRTFVTCIRPASSTQFARRYRDCIASREPRPLSSSSICTMRIGCRSQQETIEKFSRMDDAATSFQEARDNEARIRIASVADGRDHSHWPGSVIESGPLPDQ